jgi:quercetin dioxygenase-like cupin family protein
MKVSGKARRQLVLAGLGSLGAKLAFNEAHAQDAAKVMPRTYRVALENDRLRVLEFTGRPGMGICGESMHSHPAHLTVVLNDFQGKVTTPDGKVSDRARKAGDVFWAEAETHKLENTGRTNSRVLIIELKSPPQAKKT